MEKIGETVLDKEILYTVDNSDHTRVNIPRGCERSY